METEGARAVREAEDEWIVLRCQLGERDAFDELIARWHPLLWRYASRMTGDDDAAADVVQDVWLRAWRGLPKLRDAARFRAWVFGIARRVLMDRLRVRYAEPTIESLAFEEPAAGAVDETGMENWAEVEAELKRLPLAEREVLVLFYLEELSLLDIAAIAGIPVGTVKSRLFRARQLLRSQLARKGMYP